MTISLHDLGEPIAIGNTAEVYDIEPGWVLKLFHNSYSRGAVEYEHRVHQAVYAAGIPVPQARDEIVECEGRFGILYEKVAGDPMARILERKPWRFVTYARKLAELQVAMHARPVTAEGLSTMKERLARKMERAVSLPQDVHAAALEVLQTLPDGDRLCHGDYHFENILVDGEKFYIIDWVDATVGSPVGDVARTSVIIEGVIATHASPAIRLLLKCIHAIYLRRYFHLHPGGQDEYQRWKAVIAAGRLSEGMPELQDWLLDQTSKYLN